MELTRFAIDNNRITLAALVVVLLSGIFAYRSLPRSEDPGFIIRTAVVQTVFPGASPERVEMLVTDKLEKVIQEMPELDYLRSTSKVGLSVIYVNIKESYTRMQALWDKLRRKVEKARGDLPEGVIGPTVDDEFGDVFGTLIALTGDGFSYRELKTVADQVRDELLLVPEVAKVEIVGDQEERIFADFDNARLAEYGLSPVLLSQALQARNIILPGGDFTTPYERIVFEPSGSFESVEDLRQTVINVPGTRELVRLGDVVEIYRGYVEPPETRMRSNGVAALTLAISLREGGNILDLGTVVQQVIERAHAVYPIGVDFEFFQFQPGAVDKKIKDFVSNLLQAVLIVAAIMLLFLGLRTGLVVASLIPCAMISAFLVMSLFGIGLDQMSLASLIIALGMLVDNAIVMSESIIVQMESGKPAREAAIDSARELRLPLLTSSLTTAAAFLPIYLAESTTGEYTAPLFKVVTITLLCSWIIALTVIPLLAVTFLKVKRRRGGGFETPFYRGFRTYLNAILARPLVFLAAVAVVFLVAMQGLRSVPNIFFPPNDRASFTIEVELPEGSPIRRTDRVVADIEAFIGERLRVSPERRSGVINWGAFVGQGAPRFMLPYTPEPPSPNYGYLLVNATDRAVIDDSLIPPLERLVRESFPEVNATIRPLPLGAPAWPPVAIRISGRDTDRLFAIVDEVKARLRQVPGARQVSDNWGARSKKIRVGIDNERARLAGVSHQDIAISMQTYLKGLTTTEYREGDQLIPIVLRARGEDRLDLARMSGMAVFSQATGRSVPLSQVAEPEIVWQPSIIERRDRLRTVTVEALLSPGYSAAEVNGAILPWLMERARDWPFGYGWEFGGEAETSGKANASIVAKLPVAGLIIVLLLVAQFNSFRRPLIILVTIPLSLIGVVVGLLVARSYFGFMTLLGIISLAGIVINNAIVLLDRIRIEIDERGLSPDQAIVSAAQQRLRPILLTTATTVGGLLPLWLGGGPMWEPMAISIIFGLIFATVLTLGVVPVLYRLLFRVGMS